MAKLTKRNIDDLKPGDSALWDEHVKGFGLIITKGGTKSSILKYRNQYKRQQKMTLGRYGSITLDQARQIAKDRLTEVANGKDPARDKIEKRTNPSMKDLLERYLEEHIPLSREELR